MCKFYRYIIYKLYSWGAKRENESPVAKVILTLFVVHSFQLMTLYAIPSRFIPGLGWEFNPILLYPSILLFMLMNFLVLYNKKKWKLYVKEFEKENPKQKRRGTVLVLSYLIGSIVMFYVVLLLLFYVFRGDFTP